MAEEYVLRIVEGFDGSDEGESKGKKPGVGAAIGAGLSVGAGIEMMKGLLSMVQDAIVNVLKPIKTIVTGLLKIAGELLRPIVDMLMLLLRPILIMLRPFIQMFKTMMQPFINIARQFGDISAKRMAAGDITGSMQASMEGLKTIFMPFIVSLSSVLLQMATSVFSASIQNIGDMLLDAIGWLIPPLKGKMNDVKASFDSGMQTFASDVNAGIVTITQDILGGMLKDANEKLVEYKTKWPEITNTYSSGLSAMVDATTTYVDRLQAQANRLSGGTSSSSGKTINGAIAQRLDGSLVYPNAGDTFMNYVGGVNSFGSSAPKSNKTAFEKYISGA